ncbi:hypothetical protein J4Q44_G00149050 [Coregonus suidteri]|uniref:Uncharacterized protein n=1 Tax=Coregonus suidteri TaxID=861788 RepID=A0AAN8MAA2_9TELE
MGSSSSPVLTPLRPPDDLKSNILKAQAEAALKSSLEEHVVIGDKNTNLQEAAASQAEGAWWPYGQQLLPFPNWTSRDAGVMGPAQTHTADLCWGQC